MKRIFFFIILLSSCRSSRYMLRSVDDGKWKCIKAIHVDETKIVEITQRAKLIKGEMCEVRLIRSIPFQDLEQLPERRGLDDLIKEKNCPELVSIFTGTLTMPVTYLDSGPLDLTPKNSKRTFKVSKGYELVARTNSTKTKLYIKQLK